MPDSISSARNKYYIIYTNVYIYLFEILEFMQCNISSDWNKYYIIYIYLKF